MAYKLQTLRSGATQLPEEMIDFLTVKGIAASGVFDFDNGDFDVQQNPAPSMGVTIKMGAAWLRKADGSMVYPVNLETQDATQNIAANASGNPRIDAVVLYIDLAAASDAGCTNVAKFMVVQGAPAASPQAPSDASISAAVGAANPFLRLANVSVANGAATIVDANITDTRVNFTFADSFKQCFEVGDIKTTMKPTLLGRWLKLNESTPKTIGGTGSTADYKGEKYKPLFDFLVTTLGYTPTATWAANGKVVLPDAINRFLVGGGGAYPVGSTGGSDTHTNPISVEGAMTTSTNGDHNHYSSIGSTGSTTPSGASARKGSSDAFDYIPYSNFWDHYHTVTGYTANNGNHAHTTPTHDHGGNTGAANHVPKFLAVNYFIKY